MPIAIISNLRPKSQDQEKTAPSETAGERADLNSNAINYFLVDTI